MLPVRSVNIIIFDRAGDGDDELMNSKSGRDWTEVEFVV